MGLELAVMVLSLVALAVAIYALVVTRRAALAAEDRLRRKADPNG